MNTFSTEQLNALTGIAKQAAQEAGSIISAHRTKKIKIRHKNVGTSAASQVVTEVDLKTQEAILAILQPTLAQFDLAVLTEESTDSRDRLIKGAFWCIDPMDGTLAFAKGTPGFSVSIGLVSHDGSPLIGVVYDPVENNLYHASRDQGAYKNNQPITLPKLDASKPLILRTDYSFQHHPRLEETRLELCEIADDLTMNGCAIDFQIGAVMNACAALEIPNSCYFKYPRVGDSGGSLWDYAATACLYREAGAVATDIYGDPMALNRSESTFMNHRGLLFTTDTNLAKKIVELNKKIKS